MKKRDYGDFVQDILDSINDVVNFIDGMEFEDFINDKKTIYSVVRAIEIIGEAAKNVPEWKGSIHRERFHLTNEVSTHREHF